MSRIGVISILVEDKNQVQAINEVLHEYGEFILGRMGLPHSKRQLSIISIVVDAPNNVISSIGGKIGALNGVSSKTLYSKEFSDE